MKLLDRRIILQSLESPTNLEFQSLRRPMSSKVFTIPHCDLSRFLAFLGSRLQASLFQASALYEIASMLFGIVFPSAPLSRVFKPTSFSKSPCFIYVMHQCLCRSSGDNLGGVTSTFIKKSH